MRPRLAALERAEGWGRFVPAYALDLAISLVAVLTAGRLWEIATGSAVPNPLFYQLEGAVTRFTPFGLWDIYQDQLRNAVFESAAHMGSTALYKVLFGIRLLFDALIAAPQTLQVIWQQTQTPGDWITLVGFGGILAVSFVVLLTGGRLTLLRLTLALVGSPFAAVGVFWIAQQTALDALDGFACYVRVAPWCLLCPVACTLYWVAFPGAEHSATVTILQALGRVRIPRRRRRGIADGVSTTPLTRK